MLAKQSHICLSSVLSGLCLVAALFGLPTASAKTHRSHSAIAAFKHQQPCPANGKTSGPCPGYVIDHVKPLCAGGADDPSNMQWQTVEEGKAKDRIEREQCRGMQQRR